MTTTCAIIPSHPLLMEKVYESTITEYIRMDNNGTRTDMKFKVLSMQVRNCTMADCVKNLLEDARKEREKAIVDETVNLKDNRAKLKNAIEARCADDIGHYIDEVYHIEERIELLNESLNKNSSVSYDGYPPEKVMAVYVTCKYTTWYARKKKDCKENIETFILSPNGQLIWGIM